MDQLWQDVLAWGQQDSLRTIIIVVVIILMVSALISFAFRVVKLGLFIVIVLLLVGVSPVAMTTWVSSHMDAKNFGVAKLENANDSFLPLPTLWKATLPTGQELICHPDLSASGIGGLTCDEDFYSASLAKTIAKEHGALTLTLTNGEVLKDCEEVKEGFGCKRGTPVRLKYTAPE